jgi:integrase
VASPVRKQHQSKTKRNNHHTLSQLLELVYEHHWVEYKDGLKSYSNAKALVNLLGEDKNPDKLTTTAFDRLVKHLKKTGNKPSTINRKLSAISKVLTFAQDRGLIDFKPKIPFQPKSDNPRLVWFSHQEEQQIVEYLDKANPEMSLFFQFLCDTGLRVSEALSLHPENIVDNCIHITQSKNGTERLVPLTNRLKESIELPWSFTQRQLNYTWDKCRKDLSLRPELVIHSCRHTFCSRLVQAGVPITTVKELAGHKSISMTMRYSHLALANKVEAIEVLNR